MSNPQKRKGDAAELEAAALLHDLLGVPARRKLGAGRLDDTGDIDGVPDLTVQVANWSNVGAADAAASDYMANLLDNDADQDGRPDTAELQRLTEQSKRLTAAVPPVPLSPAPQADGPAHVVWLRSMPEWIDLAYALQRRDRLFGDALATSLDRYRADADVANMAVRLNDAIPNLADLDLAPSAPVERPQPDGEQHG